MLLEYDGRGGAQIGPDDTTSDTAFICPPQTVRFRPAQLRLPGVAPVGVGVAGHVEQSRWLLRSTVIGQRLETLVCGSPIEAAVHSFQSQSLTEVAPCASNGFHTA